MSSRCCQHGACLRCSLTGSLFQSGMSPISLTLINPPLPSCPFPHPFPSLLPLPLLCPPSPPTPSPISFPSPPFTPLPPTSHITTELIELLQGTKHTKHYQPRWLCEASSLSSSSPPLPSPPLPLLHICSIEETHTVAQQFGRLFPSSSS